MNPAITMLLAALSAQTTTATTAPFLAQPPQLVRMVQVELPDDTVYSAPEIEVTLRLAVTTTGTVASVVVTEGVGAPFDEAAARAGQQLVFTPGLLNTGAAVPVTITFRMTITAPPPPPEVPPPPPPVSYKGQLLERGTRKPLVGIEVTAQQGETRTSTFTDDAGRFSLNMPPPRFDVLAEPITHAPLRALVEAKPGESIEETFYLVARRAQYEVVVRGRAVQREVVQRTLTKAEIVRSPGTAGDTLKAVANLPGVSRSAFDGGQVILRGSAPGDSGTFLEGHEIPQIYHFGGLRSTFTSAFLEALTFIPGNFSADYGRFVGGIIDVQVRDPASDAFRGELDINVYDASLVLEGPVSDGVSIGGAFRRSYIDAILPAVIPEDAAVSFDTAPRFYDYQLIGSWKPSPQHDARVIWYGSRDRLELILKDPADDPKVRGTLSTAVMFHALQVSARSKLSSAVVQDLSMQVGLQEINFDLGPDFFFSLTSQRIALRASWNVDITKWLELRAGLDTRYTWVQLALAAPTPPKEGENPPPLSTVETVAVDRDLEVFEPGVFLEARLMPVKMLTIVPSVRFDYYDAINHFTVDPRLGAELKIFEDTSLHGGLGLYQQQPQYDESSSDIGAPDLIPERSVQGSIGGRQRLFDALDIEITGFYKWLDNLVVRNPAFFSDPNQPVYTNGGTGRIFGLELLVRANYEGFAGWVAYTFQRSYRTDAEDAKERRFDFDQPHILTAVAGYDFGAGWTVGARFRLVSGNPDTPIDSAFYDSFTDVFVPVYGEINSERLGTFHQLDLRIDKVWTFDVWKLNLYLDVQNVYNRANPEGWTYNYDYSERSELSGLPILPILGMKGAW